MHGEDPRYTALREHAASQGGVFTRRQAIAAGFRPGEVDHLLRTAEWSALRRGVYTVRPVHEAGLDRLALQAAAGILALPVSRVVASHVTAALLHGLPVLPGPDVVVTRPPGSGSTRRLPGLRVHVAGLPASHVTSRAGVPLTTPARTVVDLARRSPYRDALVLADAAMRAALVRLGQLERVLLDCATWPGIVRAARVVAAASGRSESPLESLCRIVFARHGLPPPRQQVVLADERTGWSARVDFLWPEHRVVVEADGLSKYTDVDVLRREKLRQERIEESGYTVVRVTWAQITREPAATVERIRRVLDRAGRLRPGA